MIVLLIVKILCDFGYYFLFANYLGHFGQVHYSLALTLCALTAAAVLSGALEKRGRLRLLPPALALLLLVQCRGLIDVLVLVPPLIYLWIVCVKCLYWPDEDHQREVFSVQWKTLVVLPFIVAITSDFAALQRHCLPMLVIFLTTAIMCLRMMRHSPAVLRQPRFQVQNIAAVVIVTAAALLMSTDGFFAVMGVVVKGVMFVISPIIDAVAWVLSGGFSLIMKIFLTLLDLLRKAMGREEPDKPKIREPGNSKEELNMEQEVVPTGETLGKVLTVIVIVVALIAAFFLFKKMLGRRKKGDKGAAFEQSSLYEEQARRERDRLLAPKDPREAVRWYYRRFLKYCTAKKMNISPYYTSRQIADLAERDNVAQVSHSEPLRELYIQARYSGNAVTEEDAKQAKELVKRIKDGGEKQN